MWSSGKAALLLP